jgi:hypothetical protein
MQLFHDKACKFIGATIGNEACHSPAGAGLRTFPSVDSYAHTRSELLDDTHNLRMMLPLLASLVIAPSCEFSLA